MYPPLLLEGKSGRLLPHRGGRLQPPRCSKTQRERAQNEVGATPLRRKKRYTTTAKAVDYFRKSGRLLPQKQ